MEKYQFCGSREEKTLHGMPLPGFSGRGKEVLDLCIILFDILPERVAHFFNFIQECR